MGSGQACVAGDGVGVDADQAGGFAGADPLGDVGQHGLGGVVGEARIEEGSPLAFGEAGLAGGAAQESAAVWAVHMGTVRLPWWRLP